MNPARSIGPALISFEFSHLWIYILWPLLGMLWAFFVYKVFQKEEN
jgi:glycerol uptake facilitator-like aquaporin